MTGPRPRVEGERTNDAGLQALAVTTDAEAFELGPAGFALKAMALDLLDARAEVARLTAEVERLTKEKAASGETKISAEHLDALSRYARDEISTGRLAELLGVSLMDLLDLRNAVQSDAPPAPEGDK